LVLWIGYQSKNKRSLAMIKKVGILLLLAISAGCQHPGGPGGKKMSGADFIKRLDKDGDGRVSAAEFDGPKEHFAKADVNQDGFLTEDEAPNAPPPGAEKGGRR
jgi:hypothetical protein